MSHSVCAVFWSLFLNNQIEGVLIIMFSFMGYGLIKKEYLPSDLSINIGTGLKNTVSIGLQFMLHNSVIDLKCKKKSCLCISYCGFQNVLVHPAVIRMISCGVLFLSSPCLCPLWSSVAVLACLLAPPSGVCTG